MKQKNQVIFVYVVHLNYNQFLKHTYFVSMGKRARSDARIREVANDYDNYKRATALSSLVSSAPNEDLFVLDNKSSQKRARKEGFSQSKSTSITTTNNTGNRKSRAKYLQDEPDEPHVLAGRKSVAGKIEGEEVLAERFIHKVLVENTEEMRKIRVAKMSESRREHEHVMLGGVGTVKARDLWADESIAPVPRPKGASSNPVPLKERVLGPGTSYNPEAEAHQEAIAEAVSKVLLRQKRRDDILSKVSATVANDAIEHDTYDPDDDDVQGDEWKKALLAAAPPAIEDTTVMSNSAVNDDKNVKTSSTTSSGSGVGGGGGGGKPLSRMAAKLEKLKSKHQDVSSRGGKRAVEMAKFDAALEEAKELVLEDGRLVSNLTVKPEVVNRRAAFLERKEASQALQSNHEPIMVPLSEELTGSLRTIKPVTAAGLVLERMNEMEMNGRAHKRDKAHAAVQLDVTGDLQLKIQSKSQVKRVKGIGKPYKQIEFPRRRGFAPADLIQEDADRELAGLPPIKRH